MLLEAKRLNLRHYFIIFDAMLFINGTINSEDGFRRADLRIKDGKIQQIGILQPGPLSVNPSPAFKAKRGDPLYRDDLRDPFFRFR